MENQAIRNAAREHGIPLWKLADQLGISEASMTRLLRKPLGAEKERQLRDAIDELTGKERKAG